MTETMPLDPSEELTALVYGDTFSLYGEEEFAEFVGFLHRRLQANDIPLEVFQNKRCLDAGCGGGRGSILMAEAGAAEVVGVDLSAKNIESAQRRAEERGLQNCHFEQQSLAELPFDSESFDVVWCNGVLHHAVDPDAGLREITRVLRTGGRLWLYLYGSGGIYWYAVDQLRHLLADVDPERCIYLLGLLGAPARRIGEWVDDWFTPHLRRYTAADVDARLHELGYAEVEALPSGVEYDTSQRRVGASSEELAYMGEGDLRYWCVKSRTTDGGQTPLPDPPDGRGSPYEEPEEVTRFKPRFAELNRAVENLGATTATAERVLVARAVHIAVRDQLEGGAPFDGDRLDAELCRVLVLIDRYRGRDR